jgi:hypothetical protein
MLQATDCREILLDLAEHPADKFAFTFPDGGALHLHGAAVLDMLRVVPKDFTSRFTGDSLGARRLLIEWSRNPGTHGRLLLRACGAIDLGDRAKEALQYCSDDQKWKRFSVTSMPDEAWAAVRQCFPAKKYCSSITAADATERIRAHGWRNYETVEIQEEI